MSSSTIETRRIAPIFMSDSIEMKYIQIPSYIMNNEFDEDYEQNYTAPSLGSVRSSKEPSSYNHEIRLLVENAREYSSDQQENTIYYLPSACFSLFKNNIFSSIVDLSSVNSVIPESSIVTETSILRKYDPTTGLFSEVSINRQSDSVLSSLYTLYFNNSYKNHE